MHGHLPETRLGQHLPDHLDGVRLVGQSVGPHLAGLQVEHVEPLDDGAQLGIPRALAEVQEREIAPQAALVGVPPRAVLLIDSRVIQDLQQEPGAGPQAGVNAPQHVQRFVRAGAR